MSEMKRFHVQISYYETGWKRVRMHTQYDVFIMKLMYHMFIMKLSKF